MHIGVSDRLHQKLHWLLGHRLLAANLQKHHRLATATDIVDPLLIVYMKIAHWLHVVHEQL